MVSRYCRFCATPLHESFADLGMTPFANAYIDKQNLQQKENFYPLHAYVCEECKLVQLEEYGSPEEIFGDYAYFSSFSETWLNHAKNYTRKVIERFHLNDRSHVVEIASNDGYLLQYFIEYGISVLGIEPASNVAKEAEKKGIPTLVRFFGMETARDLVKGGGKADLIIGNNVLAHVPDLRDFVGGLKELLHANGVITLEFPHLLQLIQGNQFDTIYHEHFSYFSLHTVSRIFMEFGLTIFDVEELSTHGGSIRLYICHSDDKTRKIEKSVMEISNKEEKFGLTSLHVYRAFSESIKETKREILSFLIAEKRNGKRIVGYGAPAKGNTLLNYCGVKTDMIDYTVDRNPVKQGCVLPGSRIPIEHPDKIMETQPDYLFILPWNIKDEIIQQMSFIRNWGGKFVIPIPHLKVME